MTKESTSQKIPLPEASFDSGSFRDRHGRVFYRDGEVLRAISADALREWDSLSGTRFFASMIRDRRIIPTEKLEEQAPEGWAAVLRHQPVPFISYPYEWPFGMLKSAALLQLDLLQASLEEGFILKDSSAFNFQWLGTRPVLIDVLSFKKLIPGEVWVGYRQFCQMFLYPLMLQAYRDLPFQARLRGDIEGISPAEMNRTLSFWDRFRAGVFSHVYLQSKFQAHLSNSHRDVKGELSSAGFARDMVLSNVRGLAKLVRKLDWNPEASEWSGYTCTTSYSTEDAFAKESFARSVIESRKWKLAWDLGCNRGEFSKMAAGHSDYVVAMDADPVVVERVYRALQQSESGNILPLVMNLADASPGLGWRGQERKSLSDRGTPDLILSLALIHHLVISANIPVKDFVNWLADFKATLVIEFVNRTDPMVQQLLLNKEDQYTDYNEQYFEQCLSQRCRILKRTALPSGHRVLYHAETS